MRCASLVTDAATVLVTRMLSYNTEELNGIVDDIKGRIAEHKELEAGAFTEMN